MSENYSSYLKNLDVKASMLLGSFDDAGNYNIDDKIKKELVLCKKLIDSFKDDIITAKAIIGGYKFVFHIYIQNGENGLKRAGLFLDETTKLGFNDKSLLTHIDNVILKADVNFFNQIKGIYNLFTPDESEGVDMNNNNLLEIINKLNGIKGKYEQYIPLFIDLDKKYVNDILSILKASGKYGEMLIINFKKLLSEKNLNKGDPKYWREVKLLLDKLLLENKDAFNKATLQKIDNVCQAYMQNGKDIKPAESVALKSSAKKAVAKKGGDDAKKKKKKSSPEKKKEEKKSKESKEEPKTYVSVSKIPHKTIYNDFISKTDIFGKPVSEKNKRKVIVDKSEEGYSANLFNVQNGVENTL